MYFVMLVSRFIFLMAFGFESGCPGLENKVFCNGGIAKTSFAEVGIFRNPGSSLHDFADPWYQFA